MVQADDIEEKRQSRAKHSQDGEQWPTWRAENGDGLGGIAWSEEDRADCREGNHENSLRAAVRCGVLERKNKDRIGYRRKQSRDGADQRNALGSRLVDSCQQ